MGDDALAPQPYLSAKAKSRMLWLKIHRWLGLALLIPMALLGFTGSMQVWPEEAEALLNPQREVAATADPAVITPALIRRRYSGLPARSAAKCGSILPAPR